MTLLKTEDREIKKDSRTGIYHYRGTLSRGGKSISRSLGVRTFRAAVLAKKDLLLKLRGIDPMAKDVPFRDYVQVFLEERKKKSQKTYEQALYCLKELTPFFETHTMRQITDAVWDEYVSYQAQIKPGRLLKYDRRHLLMMLLRCKKKGIVSEIPELRLKERDTERKRVLNPGEVRAIFKHAEGSIFGLALFMYHMGARPGEVLGAPWTEFDLDRGIWSLPAERTKTRTPRAMKLNQRVWEWLKTRQAASKSKWVFPTRENRDRPLYRYNKQWDKMLQKAGLDPEIQPYHLRHTFLTECAKKVRDGSLSLVLITKYAGTSIEQFEKTYLHIEGEDTKAVAELMEAPL